ncbi:MAG TPA: hypothetical protein DCE76_03285 [Anaerolineaceae bacterium]|jgi:hypothetical protein|nr:hypothetical protein [Anaerolineaceae bacterium]
MNQTIALKSGWTVLRRMITLLVISVLALALPLTTAQAYSGYPTFDISEVKKDQSVTIQIKNLPPNQTFTVRMNKIGTKGVGGEVVGTFNSESGGSKKLTFDIPASLKGLKLIAIRIESPQGYFAYNWFTNDPAGADTGTPSKPYSGIPTVDIVSVTKDNEVKVRTNNFPAGKTFTVRMGEYGTKGVNGTVVGSLDSGSGGKLEATFKIPDGLKGKDRIAIRLEASGGYFAYNWFYNSTGTGTTPPPGTTPTPGYSGIPTFSIKAVVRDGKVTISAKNFPADQTFTVRMGAYGTKGVNGVVVGTKETGSGGSFEATFDIPESLKGSQRIAIRMDSPQGFYAYNWFWNNTYP